jgi:hypothetical protein
LNDFRLFSNSKEVVGDFPFPLDRKNVVRFDGVVEVGLLPKELKLVLFAHLDNLDVEPSAFDLVLNGERGVVFDKFLRVGPGTILLCPAKVFEGKPQARGRVP